MNEVFALPRVTWVRVPVLAGKVTARQAQVTNGFPAMGRDTNSSEEAQAGMCVKETAVQVEKRSQAT